MSITQERQFQRADTAANWTAANPVLAAGEIGVETDTLKVKVGDGSQAWSSLPYIGSPMIPGIVADGVTDNHAALSSYLSSLSAKGGGHTPRLPAGVIATSELVIPDYVTLVGAGGIDTENMYNHTVTRLVPAAAGQTNVVSVASGSWSPGLKDIIVDALPNNSASAAQHACTLDAYAELDNVVLTGGTVSTLVGTSNAVGVKAVNLTVWTLDTLGGVKPIDNAGSDWQVSQAHINGTGSSDLRGWNCLWHNAHFITGGPAGAKGTAPLVKDGGRQRFVGCYFDGTPGTAVIDRTTATAPSTYTDALFLQSINGVTGIPVIKETTTAEAGVKVVQSQVYAPSGSTSTFANFIDAPIASSQGIGISILTAGLLTGNFAGTALGRFLFCSNAGTSVQPSPMVFQNTGTVDMIRAEVTGDTYSRLGISNTGVLTFGPGNAAGDAGISRPAAAQIGITGSLRTNNLGTLGTSGAPWPTIYYGRAYPNAASISSGTGSPNGVVTANPGSLYTDTTGGAGLTLYVKETGTGNTGWVAK